MKTFAMGGRGRRRLGRTIAGCLTLALSLSAVLGIALPAPVAADGEDYIRIDETNIRVEGGLVAIPGRLDRIGTVNGAERYSGGVTLRGEPGIRLSGNGNCAYTMVIEVRGDQVSVFSISGAETAGCEIPDLANGSNIKQYLSNFVMLRNAIPNPNPTPTPPAPPPLPTDGTPPIGCPQSSAPRDPPPPECLNIPKGCPGSTPNSRERLVINGVAEACPYTAFTGFVCPEFYRANPTTGLCEAAPRADGSCPGEGRFFRDIQNPNVPPVCRIGGTNYEVGDDPKCAVVGFGPVRCPINDRAIDYRSAGCYVKDPNGATLADTQYKEAPCSHSAFNGPQNVNCPADAPLIVKEGSCAIANCTENCNLVQKYIDPAVQALSALVGVGVAVAIVWGAIQYQRSANDGRTVAAAKRRITVALLVLVGYLLFYQFLNWVIPGGVGF